MFLIQAWPTYLFFIIIASGIFFALVDIKIRRSDNLSLQKKLTIQTIISLLLLLGILYIFIG